MSTEQVDVDFVEAAGALDAGAGTRALPTAVDGPRLLELFDSQLGSRHCDLAARWLQSQGAGFYTIGSSGHEGNAAVAAALRPTDPALLHYRSGAFYIERARQVPGQHPLHDILLGVVAAQDEPISGGRHKVFGNHDLAVIPQTSTIASHLPRAMGVAFSIDRARRLEAPGSWPDDALAVCSFGDASANHSTALGAINTALHCSYQRLPMPLLLVCEDNGLGISVPTPRGWIANTYAHRPGLEYFAADGCDLLDALAVAAEAARFVRTTRRPAFLHLRTVRLMAHAGSDVEAAYRRPADLLAERRQDPVLATARILVEGGVLSAAEVLDRYEAKRAEVLAVARDAAERPRLASAAEIMRPLTAASAGGRPDRDGHPASRVPREQRRRRLFGDTLPEDEGPLTVAQAVNRALVDTLAEHPQAIVFGEDVSTKGGVYGVTRGLAAKAGRARVFDTLLDEQSILGLALGAAVSGLLPIPEIQYLAYLHNAEDQLRGEAATLRFFSNGQYRNGMVIRVAGYAYQKGFGGHFHNDNAVAVLRDVPGLVVASPARPDDAAAMLRACAAAAAQGSVCVFLEPIARYHTKDLLDQGDQGWLAAYPVPVSAAESVAMIGRGRTHGQGRDLTIVTFGNGLFMSQRVIPRLAAQGVDARVLDLRWLAPLPAQDLRRDAEATGRVLVVDETRRSGGVSEGVLTALVDQGFAGAMARVAGEDSFIPLGDAAQHVLISEDDIEHAALSLVRSSPAEVPVGV